MDRLAALKLVVVTGKGGVGKSTLAAALGLAMARRGRRTLLLEVDPRESLYQLLGVPPTGGDYERAAEGLWVQNLRPRAVLDQVVRERVHVEMLAKRVLASPIYEHFAEAAPGLKEVAVLGHALRVAQGLAEGLSPDVDLVVLDAPATGHGVSMLAAPGLVAEVIHDGPFGHMGGELAAFVSDRDKCGILVAAAAEEMPVQEAVELIRSLADRLDRRPEAVVVNALYPEPVAGEAPQPGDPLMDLWIRRRRVNDRELGRLSEAWTGPRVELPLVALDRGPELAESLSRTLQDSLEAQSPWT